jgi:phosphoribosyl 1,2-cyclic phosphodiesterase
MEIQDLDGVFITHIHGDHVNEWTVRKLVDKYIPIYCPPQIEPHLKSKYAGLARASRQNVLKTMKGSEAEAGKFLIRCFEVPHDSDGGCFGYSVCFESEGRTKKVSISTDVARPTESVISNFADSDVIVMESNYDEDMLEQSARPVWLKRRIREDGHLSNDQCADSLQQIIRRSEIVPSHIALAHISQECNTNALALQCTSAALGTLGMTGIHVTETHPDRPGETITV